MTPEELREAVNTVRHATDTEDATAAANRIYRAFERLREHHEIRTEEVRATLAERAQFQDQARAAQAEVERLREQLAYVACYVTAGNFISPQSQRAWHAIEQEHEANEEAADRWRGRFPPPATAAG